MATTKVGKLNADNVVDGTTNKVYTATEKSKLAGIEDGAEVNNISDANATDLTDNGDSTLHFHSSDRNRSNHTGTQAASTISDFDTEVSNNLTVAANTAHITSDGKSHSDVVLNNTHRTGSGADHADVASNTTHRGRTDNPHSVTKTQVGLGNVANVDTTNADNISDGITNAIVTLTQEGNFETAYTHSQVVTGNPHNVTLSDVGGTTDHTELSNIGTNTHAQIDTHIGDATIHYPQSSISITESQISDLGSYIPISEKAANNGVATLDSGGKIPANQLPSTVMDFKGTWDASLNSPTLVDGSGDAGDVYLVSVAGTQDLGSGSITYTVGDLIVYNGTIWQKSINSNAVVSVNSQTGVVSLDQDDIADGTTYGRLTNTQITDLTDAGDSALHFHSTDRARANHTGTQLASTISDFQTTVSANTDVSANTAVRHVPVTVADSPEINLTLTDQNITASLVLGSIDETKLDTSVNASLDLADSSVQPADNISTLTNDSGFISGITDEPLSDLNDVTIAAIASGEILKWNGTAWINNTLTEAGIAAIGDLHDAVTVTDSSEIDFTLTGQNITASLIAGSIDETKLDASVNASLDLADSAMQDVVDDTTPQLGGNLDLNSKALTITGQTVGGSDGNLVYLSGANTWSAADADTAATCSGILGIRLNATTVHIWGPYTTTGLTAAADYYVSETAGAITATEPTTSTSISRTVGRALSTTVLFFKPDETYIEVP